MQFRRERACETLVAACAALAAGWRSVSQETRSEIASLIREFGPRIAEQDGQNVATELVYVLRGLWGLQDRLPAAVTVALRAGAGASSRSVTVISEDERAAVLAALTGVCDARPYSRPAALARRINDLIHGHADLLIEEEQDCLAAFEADYTRSGNPLAYLDRVAELLPHVETIQALLAANRTWTPTRAAHDDGMRPADTAVPAPQLLPAFHYAHALFPPEVLLWQRRVPLVLHISAADSDPATALAPAPGELIWVLTAEDFAISSAIGGRAVGATRAARAVTLAPTGESEPVVYLLDPLAAGRKRFIVDVYQGGASLASLHVDTRVVEPTMRHDYPGDDEQALAFPARACPTITPPDLELRVMLLADGKTLSFMLHSYNGDYNFRDVGRVMLLGDPRTFLDSALGELSRLARLQPSDRTEGGTREAFRRINAIGMRLYDELLPEQFKAEYASIIRHNYAGKTLQITSDEPWIPWEIIRPFAVQGGRVVYNDPPLCENFLLSRWLAGRGAPSEVRIGRGLIVAPPGNLAAVRTELDYFSGLRRRHWGLELKGPVTRVADVLQEVEGGAAQLFHFSSHGNFDASDPLASALRLSDGLLRPAQLLGEAQAGIARAAPLVFLNACHAGQNGLMLTRMGGWAETFLTAGAGAFAGSLWEINDILAAAFARAFYDALLGLDGRPARPIAAAFREARLAIKALDPANPTWLAYVLYASPNTRVTIAPAAI